MRGQTPVLLSLMLFPLLSCSGDKLEETQFRELYPTVTLNTESLDFETVVLYTDTQKISNHKFGTGRTGYCFD